MESRSQKNKSEETRQNHLGQDYYKAFNCFAPNSFAFQYVPE
jgi:hypothetical protein